MLKTHKFTAQKYMKVALKLAKDAALKNEVPIAAIITDKSGKIIAKAHNAVEKYKSPLKHAEMIVIERALKKVQTLSNQIRLDGFSIFVTLEPCPMCAAAISHARISNLYYAAPDEKGGAVENGIRLFEQKTCLHKPEVINGIMLDESSELLKNYFKKLREVI